MKSMIISKIYSLLLFLNNKFRVIANKHNVINYTVIVLMHFNDVMIHANVKTAKINSRTIDS